MRIQTITAHRINTILALAFALVGVSIPHTAVAEPFPQVTPNNQSPKVAPAVDEELMARLVILARGVKVPGVFSAKLCRVLNVCDGTKGMSLKFVRGDLTDARHYFAIPPEADSKDILIIVVRETIIEAYLTDKTRTLRAAGVLENDAAHLITNEKAAKGFMAELAQFAKEASEQLPPTGGRGGGRLLPQTHEGQ